MSGDEHALNVLTARERDILRLVALGLSNRDIAEELVLAPETVRWYTKQIYSKLGVTGRIQAINRARESGLLHDNLPAQPAPDIQASLLPTPTMPFIGRHRELADVVRLLENGRLLTLTGVAGSGKTRLALRAVEMIARVQGGAYFIDLAPLTDPGLVIKAIASSLGVIETPAEPQLQTLKRVLTDRDVLLVIDNFEHVIEEAPLVSELLSSAPRLRILVTSREALRLSGEQEYLVPPLSLPTSESVEAVAESEAASLFLQRAQLLLPSFKITEDNASAIAQICSRLDGLPLAIELAAARCKLLSPQAILARLESPLSALTGGTRDAPLRQQTLRRTLDWSYNLLTESEKTLFARLSVFRGGRSMDAIEAVCGHDLKGDVFGGLVALVDKNLLQQKEVSGAEPRFVMLETIHEYARERLAGSEEAENLLRRYAEYFVALAERAEPELRLAQQSRWSQVLELELHNLRAVMKWSLDDGDVALGVRLAGALHLFWWAYGYHVEGYRWTQQLLKRLREVPSKYHLQFLFSASMMAIRHYDFEMVKYLLNAMRETARELADQRFTAWALVYWGHGTLGDTEAALVAAEEGLARFRELDYRPGIAVGLNALGEYARIAGDDERARRAYEECVTICQETGDTRRIQINLLNLAFLAQHQSDHARAIDLARQSLRLARQMRNRLEIGGSLAILAGSLGSIAEPEQAARLLGASEAALERMGALRLATDQQEFDRIIADVRSQLDDTAFEAAWAEGRALTLDQAMAIVLEEET